jgi:hypothetical protein
VAFDLDDETPHATSRAVFTGVVLAFELPSLLLLLAIWSMPGPSSASAAIDAQPGLELACRIALTAVPAAVLVPAARRKYWVAALIQIFVLIAALVLAPV